MNELLKSKHVAGGHILFYSPVVIYSKEHKFTRSYSIAYSIALCVCVCRCHRC